MSTIASPRDGSGAFPRRMNSSQSIVTPTSSNRPSLDVPRSSVGSPNPNTTVAPSSSTPTPTGKRNNRAALREYYNLRKAAPPTLEVTDPLGEPASRRTSTSTATEGTEGGSFGTTATAATSELDAPDLDAEEFARRQLASCSLAELVALYARVLGEMRALDAERKALVYDNYSKLISATETIRRMRSTMDPLDPVARTLEPAVARICEQAGEIREAARRAVAEARGSGGGGEAADEEERRTARERRARTRELAVQVLETPDRLRRLVAEGKLEDAKREWELPRRLLVAWKEKGLGGSDVDECIEEGDAALRGGESRSSGEGR